MASKSDAGTYDYQSGNHRIDELTAVAGYYPREHHLTYTAEGKLDTITEITDSTMVKKLSFGYGLDNQRFSMKYMVNDTLKYTRYYDGNYEKEIKADGTVRHLNYIYAGNGLIAIFEQESGSDTTHYVYTDYLGSLRCITDSTGTTKQMLSFDAWGNRRNPITGTHLLSFGGTGGGFSRGYTGHEHLDEVGLINMNGRVYDPRLGMFISVDNYVQEPTNSQNFNRYAYCVNNPLMYTDKNGQWFGIDDAIAAGLGFVVGYVSYGLTTDNWGWKAVAAGGVGAAVAWVGWNTMGAGAAALQSTGGAGTATSFSSGMTAVFGSAGGNYGLQFAGLTYMNSSMHKDQLNAADEKGWNGVWAFGAYSASAVLSTSLKPFSLSKEAGGFGLRQWAGVVLTDNISDNMNDGEFNFHSVHVGPVGWDANRHDDKWGGMYTIFSNGLNSGQRFDMAFETVLGLSIIKTDIVKDYRLLTKSHCGNWHWGLEQRFTINTSKLGYYGRMGLNLWNQYELFMDNHTVYQHWWNLHYNDDDTANY